MSELQVSNTFVTGDVISSSNFNTNYSDIVTYVNNRNAGSSTWDAFHMTSSTNIPTFNNSSGTQDIAQFKDNGTLVGEIFDGGIVSWPYQDYAVASTGSVFGIYDQVITGGATAKITPGVIVSQSHSGMDTSPKFTCTVAGRYLVSIQFISNLGFGTGGNGIIMIYKNGALYSKKVCIEGAEGARDFVSTYEIIDILSLSVGDYIEPYGGNTILSSQGISAGMFFVSKLA